jgi:hypothetical protein
VAPVPTKIPSEEPSRILFPLSPYSAIISKQSHLVYQTSSLWVWPNQWEMVQYQQFQWSRPEEIIWMHCFWEVPTKIPSEEPSRILFPLSPYSAIISKQSHLVYPVLRSGFWWELTWVHYVNSFVRLNRVYGFDRINEHTWCIRHLSPELVSPGLSAAIGAAGPPLRWWL